MRCWLLSLLILGPLSAFAQTSNADLPAAPMPSSASLTLATADANASLSQSQAASPNRQQPLIDPATATISITRTDAEGLALKNNPRVTASHLLALAAGQVTRETRSGELPQISAAITAEKAEDGSRIGADGLTDFASLHPRRRRRFALAAHNRFRSHAQSRREQQAATESNRTGPHSLPSRMFCWRRTRPFTDC